LVVDEQLSLERRGNFEGHLEENKAYQFLSRYMKNTDQFIPLESWTVFYAAGTD